MSPIIKRTFIFEDLRLGNVLGTTVHRALSLDAPRHYDRNIERQIRNPAPIGATCSPLFLGLPPQKKTPH